MKIEKRIEEALDILTKVGMPGNQLNTRSALTLLALVSLKPGQRWGEASNPLIGISPIMNYVRDSYNTNYAPNTRETFRRQTMHQFLEAGIAVANPDMPDRPTNSPYFVYQVEEHFLSVLRNYGTNRFEKELSKFIEMQPSLSETYKRQRTMQLVPVQISRNQEINLTPGDHNNLIKAIIEVFAPQFISSAKLIYVGDVGDKWGYFDQDGANRIGINVESHRKMPDVVFYCWDNDWLILVESVTSHGPVDPKRRIELERLF
ncbi:BsuBI/PstI family type II restriction endonuclease [Bacillota bacterium]